MDRKDRVVAILSKAAQRGVGEWLFGAARQEDDYTAAGVIRILPEGCLLAQEYYVGEEPVRSLTIFIKGEEEGTNLQGELPVGDLEVSLMHHLFRMGITIPNVKGFEALDDSLEEGGLWCPKGNIMVALMPVTAAPMRKWELTVLDDGTQQLLGTHDGDTGAVFRMCLIRKPGEDFGYFHFSTGDEAVDGDPAPVRATQITSDAVHQMWVAYNKKTGTELEV
jgi:hypothetical protein